ncbi:MAG: 30S ribosomal protein S3 [Candidatus Nealsonbacteria bacterium RBG_13_42_11]|uniref:Small ribosomal subunit protein uS3 n=1 Tax=Candidatus Nealsonbacteria bacterium RBG_13_42_11 TaxID=1801663 RepID=A0A1G2DZ09_9BACT|nr:MAG: 30S ribosomal protein S3 [Candidatus Nealsonbacteria bacterium RBG_13_42_11]
MAHKVHPKSFRIKDIGDWDSRWFNIKKIPQYLEEDFKIRKVIKDKIGKLGVEKAEIERFPGKITVIISSARPGLIIGRGGGGIEELKKILEKEVFKIGAKKELKIEIKEIRDPWTSAALSAQWVAQQIEKRVSHRRVLKQVIEKVMAAKGVKGVRVEVAGRLDGAEIARRTWLKKGRMPRQTLRADIDYAGERALCTYGIVGIKLWIYKGDKFE